MKSIKALVLLMSLAVAGAAFGKLEQTEEQKAAAAEKKTKEDAAAEKAKADLAKAQDRVAARYIGEQKAKGITVKPTPIAAAAPAGAAQPQTPPSQTPAAADPKRPPEKAEAHSAPIDPKGDAEKGDKVKNPAAKPN
jgi:hypothetical protein